MPLDHIILLALVQGLTEFLPISSSAHLILMPKLFGFVDQGLAFDISVHLGSLGAVMLYFREDIAAMISALLHPSAEDRKSVEERRLAIQIIIATIPIVIAGFIIKKILDLEMRSALIIAVATIAFGLLLWWADATSRRVKTQHDMDWKGALLIGASQILAIIPGTSRSGITMTAGLMLGFNRETAARFSFLLSIPTILMSGAVIILEILKGGVALDWSSMAIGALLSFIAAYACIKLFLKYIERMGMTVFVIYRLLLGAAILVFMS